ncbi:MAG: hypothetical protein BEN18_02135 [Epulopiscium sp. Nuni2H_MBin001]|nr:MAG: hypothetical protein BEN18_02135 [Epulopiscium sp. Nuni2H_MBin001]
MRKLFAALAVGLAMVGCGASDVADEATMQEVLIMGTNAAFPPFEYYEGSEIVGFDVDLAQLIADELGMELRVEDMEFKTLIGAVSNGMVDMVVAGMTVLDDRLAFVNFSDGYFESKQMVIVRADAVDIESVDDLEGKRIGVQINTTGDQFARAYLDDVDIIQFNKAALAVADLKNGTVEAVIVDEQPAINFVAGQDDLRLLETPFVEEEYAIAINKENIELLEAVNGALASIKANGQYDEIYSKYFAETDVE